MCGKNSTIRCYQPGHIRRVTGIIFQEDNTAGCPLFGRVEDDVPCIRGNVLGHGSVTADRGICQIGDVDIDTDIGTWGACRTQGICAGGDGLMVTGCQANVARTSRQHGTVDRNRLGVFDIYIRIIRTGGDRSFVAKGKKRDTCGTKTVDEDPGITGPG